MTVIRVKIGVLLTVGEVEQGGVGSDPQHITAKVEGSGDDAAYPPHLIAKVEGMMLLLPSILQPR